ncbi:hypothetical protein Slin14017_G033520 [Septoria linicola]|nr:hypothetical protein Slin14017_G033520 [Septoria linicola]
MSRFPPVPHDQQPDDTKPYSQYFEDGIEELFGPSGQLMKYRDENNAIIGPWPIIIASKQVGRQLMSIFEHLPSLGKIPEDVKEIAILIVGARFEADYERYGHKLHGMKRAGLTQEQVDLLAVGKRPAGLSEAANLAYDATHHLAYIPGPLPQHLFDACERSFGRDGTLLLVHYTALYCYMCVLMNAADVPLPKGEKL